MKAEAEAEIEANFPGELELRRARRPGAQPQPQPQPQLSEVDKTPELIAAANRAGLRLDLISKIERELGACSASSSLDNSIKSLQQTLYLFANQLDDSALLRVRISATRSQLNNWTRNREDTVPGLFDHAQVSSFGSETIQLHQLCADRLRWQIAVLIAIAADLATVKSGAEFLHLQNGIGRAIADWASERSLCPEPMLNDDQLRAWAESGFYSSGLSRISLRDYFQTKSPHSVWSQALPANTSIRTRFWQTRPRFSRINDLDLARLSTGLFLQGLPPTDAAVCDAQSYLGRERAVFDGCLMRELVKIVDRAPATIVWPRPGSREYLRDAARSAYYCNDALAEAFRRESEFSTGLIAAALSGLEQSKVTRPLDR